MWGRSSKGRRAAIVRREKYAPAEEERRYQHFRNSPQAIAERAEAIKRGQEFERRRNKAHRKTNRGRAIQFA